MLKEEKDNLNEQLINLISEKESLEELSKLYIQNIYAPLNGINKKFMLIIIILKILK